MAFSDGATSSATAFTATASATTTDNCDCSLAVPVGFVSYQLTSEPDINDVPIPCLYM